MNRIRRCTATLTVGEREILQCVLDDGHECVHQATSDDGVHRIWLDRVTPGAGHLDPISGGDA